ncbi:MAG: hypothetical protein BGO69_08895 [Bacteroidetes bacterium 46-16]|nr:MAG: hypothetical protein BGO69_08895 [Bacteroidetes bacterium 46-16]
MMGIMNSMKTIEYMVIMKVMAGVMVVAVFICMGIMGGYKRIMLMTGIDMMEMMRMVNMGIIVCPAMVMVIMRVMIMLKIIMMMPKKAIMIMVQTVPMQLLCMVRCSQKAVQRLLHIAKI